MVDAERERPQLPTATKMLRLRESPRLRELLGTGD
jgi:hypothetical protein